MMSEWWGGGGEGRKVGTVGDGMILLDATAGWRCVYGGKLGNK